jgi:hypothetical protein
MFGAPPDLSELQTPCTVLLEDIGALQQIFQADQRNMGREGYNSGSFNLGGSGGGSAGSGPWDGSYRRSVRAEFGGYLRDLINKPGVFFMATSQDDFVPDDSIMEIVGPMQRISVDNPDSDERRAVWERIKLEHASMQGISTEALVEYSTDLPRATLFGVTQQAVDEAYRASLGTGQYKPMRLSDILTALTIGLDFESEAYRRLEDAAAIEFLHELDEGKLS